MKVVALEALTKLIQLVKSAFIKVEDVTETTLIDTEVTSEVTLATVATTGAYGDLTGTPTIPTVDQTYDSTSSNAQSGIAIAGAGFLTSSALNGYATQTWVTNTALSNYVTTNTSQTITHDKTFSGDNLINLHPSSATSTSSINWSYSGLRMGYIQFNPRTYDKVNGTSLLTLGNYANMSEQQVTYLGFRQYANYTSGGISVQGSYNLLSPRIIDAKELFPLSLDFPTFYLPLAFYDGANLITCDPYGKVDLSSSFSSKQDSLVSGTNIKTINNESILGSGNITISGGGSYTAGTNISIVSDEISTSAAQVIIRRL